MKKINKIAIIAKFAFKEKVIDGQTVKSKTILDALVKKYGKENVSIIDTYNWKNNKIKLLKKIFDTFKKSDNIIMLPAQRGVMVFSPLLVLFNKIYKKKIYYIVIGSWLYKKIKNKYFLKKCLEKFNYIYVETTNLYNKMKSIGFKNVFLMKNYKPLKVINKIKTGEYPKNVLKICIFSRINYKKGIEDAIKAVDYINDKSVKIKLDLYGPIDNDYFNDFELKLQKYKKGITYCGIVKYFDTVNCIKEYDYLLFPTRYYTEGIPGTIIDAFASGVPVITSRWENYKDVVDEGNNGLSFEFSNYNSLVDKLLYVYENQNIIYSMKKNCISSASKFCSLDCLNTLFKHIDLK